jgi:hypothetical protein
MQDIEKSVNEVLESIYNDTGNLENLEMWWLGTDEEFEEFAKTLLSAKSDDMFLSMYPPLDHSKHPNTVP